MANSSETSSSDRILREQEFHDARFSDEMSRADQEKFYWAIKDGRAIYDARIRELAKDSDVLEYGCSTGHVSHSLAPQARSVSGIDISGVAIEKANENRPTNTQFAVMNAEEMDFEDESFDLVFGSGIVHHLDVERCAKEVRRVLRVGGTALFWEPLGHNAVINMYRSRTPEARTDDEHPLLRKDFTTLQNVFGEMDVQHFGLFTLAVVPFRKKPIAKALFEVTRMMDRAVFAIPGLKWQSWYSVIEVRRAN